MARVFRLKVDKFLYDIVKMKRFGTVESYVFTIEFQKRGLPHIHLMVTLTEGDRPVTPEKIDLIVSAEIPDEKKEPVLHKLVCQFQLHGPCQSYNCWNGKNFKSGFPKPYLQRTVVINGAYPTYLRRDTGVTVKKNGHDYNHSSGIPYNKFLTLMFEAHINAEIPVSSTAIKYLYTHITKGHNRSYMRLDCNNKTQAYLDARYVSPPEGEHTIYVECEKRADFSLCAAAWCLFKFPLSARVPAVT
jgi:hypothetical protein